MLNSELNIRRAVSVDAEILALLGKATFLESFAGILDGAAIAAHCKKAHAATAYAAYLTDPSVQLWIAEVRPSQTSCEYAPVGYVMLAPPQLPVADITETDSEIKRIYLLHRFHGTGIGKKLLLQAREFAFAQGKKRLLLGVYQGNTGAVAFYESQGFRTIGTRRFTVGNAEYDDYVMACPL